MTKIKLGDEVKDKITEFEGIVGARAEYLYGCTQFQILAKCKEPGEKPQTLWVDEPQVEILKKTDRPKDKPRHGGHRSHA